MVNTLLRSGDNVTTRERTKRSVVRPMLLRIAIAARVAYPKREARFLLFSDVLRRGDQDRCRM